MFSSDYKRMGGQDRVSNADYKQLRENLKKVDSSSEEVAIRAIKATGEFLSNKTISSSKRLELQKLVKVIKGKFPNCPGTEKAADIALLRLGNQSSRKAAFIRIAKGLKDSTDIEGDKEKLKLLAPMLRRNNFFEAMEALGDDKEFMTTTVFEIVDAIKTCNADRRDLAREIQKKCNGDVNTAMGKKITEIYKRGWS